MPSFDYAVDNTGRDQFVAKAEQDIAKAEFEADALDRQDPAAASDVKTKLGRQAAALRVDVRSAEERLAEMNHAAANRWTEFEGGATAALARLKKSGETNTV